MTLYIAYYITPTARKRTESTFFPTPSLASFSLSLASSAFLHRFTRNTDEEIPPSLSRITSQISHPSEVHCSLECLDNLSDMSETDRLDFLIFRTWYPPAQNTAAFRYKPDEKVKFQPHIQHRQHKHSVRSQQAHNSRRKGRYYLSYVLWTEQRTQIFT